jgi:hypothetical protein
MAIARSHHSRKQSRPSALTVQRHPAAAYPVTPRRGRLPDRPPGGHAARPAKLGARVGRRTTRWPLSAASRRRRSCSVRRAERQPDKPGRELHQPEGLPLSRSQSQRTDGASNRPISSATPAARMQRWRSPAARLDPRLDRVLGRPQSSAARWPAGSATQPTQRSTRHLGTTASRNSRGAGVRVRRYSGAVLVSSGSNRGLAGRNLSRRTTFLLAAAAGPCRARGDDRLTRLSVVRGETAEAAVGKPLAIPHERTLPSTFRQTTRASM